MIQSALYDGTVASRLAISHELFRRLAAKLRDDISFIREFSLLTKHARAVSTHMATMNLGSLCISCSAKPNGGCCSLYMAGETDAVQMLMNLLADIDVRPVRDDARECCFLGEAGCIFLFKPMFCLNYNCSHIHHSALPDQMRELERLTGIVLTKQYQVEQLLLTRIQREGVLFTGST